MAQTISNMGMGLYQPEADKSGKKTPKQICEEKGGLWDNRTGTCFLTGPITDTTPAAAREAIDTLKGVKKEPPKEVKPTTPEVFRDEETGRLSGVTLPTGESFVGIKPKEVKDFVSSYQENTTLPQGTQPGGTAQSEANRQARLQELIKMGQQGLLSQQELQAIQEAPIDWGQALTAGSVGNLPSLLTRAGAGAGAGFLAAAPINAALASTGVGAIPAGVIAVGASVFGAITAMWGGTQANIKKQQSGEIAKTKDVLAAAKTNMRALTMVVQKDPSKAEDAIIQYYQWKSQAQRAHRKLQLETQGNLNKFMDDGTQDLSDFDLFLQPGGYADLQLARLQQAAAGKNAISDAELLEFYQEEFLDE